MEGTTVELEVEEGLEQIFLSHILEGMEQNKREALAKWEDADAQTHR